MEDGSDYGRHDDTEEFDDDEAFGEVDETVPRANTNSHDVNTANIAELLATVKEVSRAAAVLPQMKEEISQIRKELLEVKQYAEAVHSYCQTLILSSGSPTAREDEQLKQHVKPVENIFTKAYIVAAVTSTIPKYAFELVAGMNLREDCASAHLVLATVMPQENQRSVDTEAAARNSELKSLIVKLLIVHSATKAQRSTSISTAERTQIPTGQAETSSNDKPLPGNISSQTPIRTVWMNSGYIRPEIYDEVQREFSGKDVSDNSYSDSRRSKKQKMSSDSEFKDLVSRAVVKRVYGRLHQFFRAGRDDARRLFFGGLGFILCDEACAQVSFDSSMEPAVNIMTDIARAHPFTSAVACKSNTDEAKNASLISSMRAERKELHFTLNYKVTVTDGERKSTKPMVKKINLPNLALNFCMALTQATCGNLFLRRSTNSLRMVYIVAVAFRDLLVQYEKLQNRRGSNDPDFSTEWQSMIAMWKRVLPGESAYSQILTKEEILCMTSEKYKKQMKAVTSLNAGHPHTSHQGVDEVQRDVEEIELRM